jgi:predicted TIM-barrel fold metal-dependent hydrolase
MLFFRRGLAHLMFAGVFERFPDLQVVFSETGCAWIAEELQILDGSFAMGKIKGQAAYPLYHRAVDDLQLAPSEVWARNCHVGASLMGSRDVAARHGVGVDTVMWGNDYPHHEGSFPHTKLALRLLFGDVPEDEVRKMVGLNAAEVYGFDLAEMQTLADRIGPTVEEIATPVAPDELPSNSLSLTIAEYIMRAQMAAAR